MFNYGRYSLSRTHAYSRPLNNHTHAYPITYTLTHAYMYLHQVHPRVHRLYTHDDCTATSTYNVDARVHIDCTRTLHPACLLSCLFAQLVFASFISHCLLNRDKPFQQIHKATRFFRAFYICVFKDSRLRRHDKCAEKSAG